MTTKPALLFSWTDKYSVGLPEIDNQHKQLIGFINSLHAAMSAGKGKEVLAPILSNLVLYTKTHFTFEESLLRVRGYAELPSHSRIHQELTRQVLDLQRNLGANELSLTIEAMAFLKKWLGDHILTHDLAYAKAIGTLPAAAASMR